MKQVRAKKNLGQHFLTDPAIAERIAASIDDFKGYPVIEVGPGMGILTRALLDRGHDLYAIDIDTESIEYLRSTLPRSFVEEGRIIHGDILHIPDEALIPSRPDAPFVVIGNYPYNISGRLFFHFFELRHRIPCIAGMLQKEVAKRITASPGGRDYGILSVLLRSRYKGEYLFTVGKEQFDPKPQVDGGVLRLCWGEEDRIKDVEALFIKVVKKAFGQRRKMLRNALMPLVKEYNIAPQAIPEALLALMTQRAEQLDVEDFLAIAQFLETQAPE